MELKLKQISAVNYGGGIVVFAIDEDGNFWQWMRGQWGRMKNPIDNNLGSEPNLKNA